MLTLSTVTKMLDNLDRQDLELLQAQVAKRIRDHIETVGR